MISRERVAACVLGAASSCLRCCTTKRLRKVTPEEDKAKMVRAERETAHSCRLSLSSIRVSLPAARLSRMPTRKRRNMVLGYYGYSFDAGIRDSERKKKNKASEQPERQPDEEEDEKEGEEDEGRK